VNGLFYTGVGTTGSLLAGGAIDSHWTVSFARVNGTNYTTNTYAGSAYVLSSNYIDAGYVPNTTSAQWITAPGASTAANGGTVNVGGDYLPGNGTTNTNSAYYVYRLAFNVAGTGSGAVSNQVSISLTIAADDQYAVYVNPASAPTVNGSGTINSGGTAASATGLAAWGNTTSIALQNFGGGGANNAGFVIGTNYLYIVVANTNSQTGQSNSSALNPSGLLVYQIGSATAIIDGHPVPEVGTWIPVVAALGLFGWRTMRRRSSPAG
jgi:hypothetical protein